MNRFAILALALVATGCQTGPTQTQQILEQLERNRAQREASAQAYLDKVSADTNLWHKSKGREGGKLYAVTPPATPCMLIATPHTYYVGQPYVYYTGNFVGGC